MMFFHGYSSRRGRGCRGFTLAELLVVLGIISVLAALVAGATVLLQRKAQSITCSSNLRQIYAALSQYAADSSGYLPRAVDAGVTQFLHWPHIVQKYSAPESFSNGSPLSNVGVLQCPSHPSTGQSMETGYSINAYPAFREPGELPVVQFVILGSVKNPSKVIYLADVSDSMPLLDLPPLGLINYRWQEHPDTFAQTFKQMVFSREHLPFRAQERVARSRHRRGVLNALHMDGHVKDIYSADITMDDFDDGVRSRRRVLQR
jgi:prepilin-type N-terminal cleavage/methylation domain-containing protein/prepilin-type processing-associated H-X9-DG protein